MQISISKKSSFTLVELMIVLAILAILAAVIIFAIKPGNIIDQTNDYKRVSDLNNISKSINYLNTIQLGLLNLGSPTTIYVSLPDNTSTTCNSYALPSLPTGYIYACKNTTDYKKNDATGWIPINFRESDNSNILSSLPVDPTNNLTYYYTYFPGGSFELTAQLTKGRDSSINDNGNSTLLYETGTPNHVASPIVRDSGLIAYWDFDEGSGSTALDRSGHGYNGTLNGPTYTALTSTEQTLYWDASGADYISTPSFAIPNTGILTIEAWMKSQYSTITHQGILGCGASDPLIGYIFLLRVVNTNTLDLPYAYGASFGESNFTNFFQNLDNQWIHLMVVSDYSNRKMYAYRNGLLFGTNNLTGTPVFPSTNNVKYIGARNTTQYKITDGSLDEVRIYNRELNADEVAGRYNSTRGRYQ